MSNYHKARTSGFTIVELLIVIVVIAILAAITIVAYNGIQDRARNSAAQNAAAQAKKKLEVYKLGDGNGSYPTTGNLAVAGLNESDGYQYTSNGTSFCVTASSGNKSYTATDTTNPTSGCAGHGQGGQPAVTNLVVNPSAESNTTDLSYRWYGNTGGNGANSRPISGGAVGNAYMKKTWSAGGLSSDNGFNTSTSVAVSPNMSYTGSCYLRSNRSDLQVRVGFAWYDTSNTLIGSGVSWSSTSLLPANSWYRTSGTLTSPSNAAKAYFVCSNSNSVNWQANDSFDGDGFMVTSGSNLFGYADGNTQNWAWTTTQNNSTSTGPAL